MNARRSALLCLFLVLAAAQSASGASAAPIPPGPRLALVRFDIGKMRSEVLTAAADPAAGAAPAVAKVFTTPLDGKATGPIPYPSAAPLWTPDGARIIFEAAGRAGRSQPPALFWVAAAGGAPHLIPGTNEGIDPVVSADGQTLAFARTRSRPAVGADGSEEIVFEGTTIWTTSLADGITRRLTPWRKDLQLTPSSFSPDGSTLAATRLLGVGPKASEAAVTLPATGGPTKLLLADAEQPIYSPDGTRIAFLRGPTRRRKRKGGSTTVQLTDIYTADAGGADVTRLTSTPAATELAPAWDPSGRRLAFTRAHPFLDTGGVPLLGDEIVETNADGTCPETLLSEPHAVLLGATWQPGPGREAAPISC